MNYQKKTIQLIAIATLLRCLVAGATELGNDEVYYRMYAQYMQWNYFDHPPMVGWLIRLTTANLLLDSEFFIRLGAIASAAATTWLFFLCGKKLLDARTGFTAALIYTATLYGSIIAGTFILPDSPQMVCWSSALYLLIIIADAKAINKRKKGQLMCFGILSGIGMLCKIHTSFLWLGFLLYIILYNPQWLRQPALYLSGFITLAFFYPVIQWNIDNHFVTWLYHSKRVNISSGGLDPASFLTFAGGQLLYTNPVLFPFFVLAVIAAIKNKVPVVLSQRRILLFCSLPLILVAAVVSLLKTVLPHWTGPAYSGLILLTACYFSGLSTAKNADKLLVPKSLKLSLSLLAFICLAGILVIHFYPGTLGSQKKRKSG
ncbi:glycosyltransferase family 39 protein [Ferruginibacter paludis]|uniref:ArnT family glycosyltransferase n=1 Tax=Ferruginibacter paludis TaxID=1310417 RepID=UPI0025B3A194|nr:glycosyltransferase family 39 protein [Ferruginibacter paludis]MDN3656717.1 glycosyltransferase family 39 protein [Ferruginibacter paludis]